MDNSSSPRTETEKYKAIIQAAEKLFTEKGYHGVSTEQIAVAAGVSKGLVHYHFNSKEQLIVCILEDIIAKLKASLEEISNSNETSQVKIQRIIETYLMLANPRLELARTMLSEDVFSEQTSRHIMGLMEENTLKLEELVEAGITSGEFRQINSRLVANMMRGAIFELVGEAALQQRGMRPADEIAAEIAGILCGGINA